MRATIILSTVWLLCLSVSGQVTNYIDEIICTNLTAVGTYGTAKGYINVGGWLSVTQGITVGQGAGLEGHLAVDPYGWYSDVPYYFGGNYLNPTNDGEIVFSKAVGTAKLGGVFPTNDVSGAYALFWGNGNGLTNISTNAISGGLTNQVLTTHGWDGSPSVTNLNVTNINLFPTVSSTVGCVNQGGVNWLSTYGVGNLFIGTAGAPSGNFTASGTYNVGLGRAIMNVLSSGVGNVGIGNSALLSCTSGGGNMAIGANSLQSLQTSSDNVAIGATALNAHKGSFSVAIGTSALSLENASGNTGVGRAAGATITSGNYNTFIGYNAGFNASQKAESENSMALGNGAYTTNNNQVVIGNSSVTQQVLYGNVIISGNVRAPDGLYYFPQTNGLVGAMTNFTPIHAFGSIMSWGTNVIVTNAATYHPVTNNVTYSTARTNQFGANVAAGILTNLLAGFYYCSIHLSGVAVDNGAWVEGDLLLDGVQRDEISFITVFDPGTPRIKGMSAFGILYIPANTKISFQVKSSGAGGINVYRAQVSVCSP